ncbi:hypothetical protein [Pseudosporangium ferrugineum]|uniref:Uncharacterized protein n=1 Tax=Pseudosporangium ferrugineum TaxID=439699 RepID=A0A2T0S7B4_9ACTN|nr:hypothetical protein [Pseudosporangium ferrugineum]PRY29285.1 hypothetical protein CLV70_1062 [Pseudosporangium ferrugineum]
MHRAASDVIATAQRILGGLEQDDPVTLANLPRPDVDSPVDFVEQYTGYTSELLPAWGQLTPREQRDAFAAYVDGFGMAVVSRTIARCITELGERGIAV